MTRDDDGYFSIVTEIPSGVREVSISTAHREKGSYHALVTYRVK
jgi:hypothetical protein